MTFDISKFRTDANKYHKLSHFKMEIPLPEAFKQTFDNDTQNTLNYAHRKLDLYIESATMPGISLGMDEIRRYGVGFFERKPYAALFTEVDLNVRSDSYGTVYDFFQTWMKLIVNYDVRNENMAGSTGEIFNPNRGIEYSGAYEVAYKKYYKTLSSITAFDDEGNEVKKVYLKDAFPFYLGNVQYNWSQGNEIVTFPVKMSFSSWYQDNDYRSTPEIAPNNPYGAILK